MTLSGFAVSLVMVWFKIAGLAQDFSRPLDGAGALCTFDPLAWRTAMADYLKRWLAFTNSFTAASIENTSTPWISASVVVPAHGLSHRLSGKGRQRTTARCRQALQRRPPPVRRACERRTGGGRRCRAWRHRAVVRCRPFPLRRCDSPCAGTATDAEIHGVDVFSIEAAVKELWKAGIFAESAMGCTGPVVKVQSRSVERSREVLSKTGYLEPTITSETAKQETLMLSIDQENYQSAVLEKRSSGCRGCLGTKVSPVCGPDAPNGRIGPGI